MFSLEQVARYPFCSRAKKVLEEKKVGLSAPVIEKAKKKILAAAKGEEAAEPIETGEKQLLEEIASYAAARLILSVLKKKPLISRFAVAEQKRVNELLKKENEEALAEIARELGVEFCDGGMRAFSYLLYSPRSEHYKLVNREVSNGVVKLSRSEKTRVASEALMRGIEASLPLQISVVPEEVKKAASEIERMLPREAPAVIKVEEGSYPPCMKKLLQDLGESENLPHQARFALACYLLNVGVPKEKVALAFQTAPDYDAKTTAYQVDFIAKKGYKVPACSVLDMNGVCVADCRVGTPLKYRPGREKPWKEEKR